MKFILIVSDEYDVTTSYVCQCLKTMGEKFIRINWDDTLHINIINIEDQSNLSIRFKGRDIQLKEVKAFWHRRGTMSFFQPSPTGKFRKLKKVFSVGTAIGQVENDNSRIRDFLFDYLEKNTKSLGSYFRRHNNKLSHIALASRLGLTVPKSIITTNKSDLVSFISECQYGVITKVTSDAGVYSVKKDEVINYSVFTNCISQSELKDLPETFGASLFQENLIKKADIRVFYIDGEFYSMAIISQADLQTETDFRRYNYSKPNRKVPFALSGEIEQKLDMFMKEVGLNTGSIDFVYGIDKKLYFLEVNPVGQFGMVSRPCNYNLEMRVAKFLAAEK